MNGALREKKKPQDRASSSRKSPSFEVEVTKSEFKGRSIVLAQNWRLKRRLCQAHDGVVDGLIFCTSLNSEGNRATFIAASSTIMSDELQSLSVFRSTPSNS